MNTKKSTFKKEHYVGSAFEKQCFQLAKKDPAFKKHLNEFLEKKVWSEKSINDSLEWLHKKFSERTKKVE